MSSLRQGVLSAREARRARELQESAIWGEPAYIEGGKDRPCSIVSGKAFAAREAHKLFGPWVMEPQAEQIRCPPGLEPGVEPPPSPPPGLEHPACRDAGYDPCLATSARWMQSRGVAGSYPGVDRSRYCRDPEAWVRSWQLQQQACSGQGGTMDRRFWQTNAVATQAFMHQCPDGKRPKRMGQQRRHCRLTIAESLQELESEEVACVVSLRQIHVLGMDAPEILREHCARYGAVKKVLLSNATEKSGDCPFAERLRPSRFGFVVMDRAEDAAAMLAEGSEQVVSGKTVSVRRFTRCLPRREPATGEDAGKAPESPASTKPCPGDAECASGAEDAYLASTCSGSSGSLSSLRDRSNSSWSSVTTRGRAFS